MPQSQKQWTVTGSNGFDSLSYADAQVPALGDDDVLVKCKFRLHFTAPVCLMLLGLPLLSLTDLVSLSPRRFFKLP